MQSSDRGPDAEEASGQPGLDQLMLKTAQGDQEAFAQVYDQVNGRVLGLVLRVVRNAAQSEEVAQDVLVEVWRTAGRFRPEKGTAMTWILTLAHRRAVDRVRAAQASVDRDAKAALLDHSTPFDEVAEEVETRMEWERVRRCVQGLTEIQREAVTLAYYGGLTYKDVAEALTVPLGTIKTRLRDGLIRLRDCLGVAS
ncbi:sigma-70 family RNA polymerase sigma factor [Streptomyces sp. NPDC058685]|uniref:sigma-70 family RNA polymerase sigma factor n=1 Tax=Streptomyces sp. NPDC058685 TaxID=3346598 RepID=UPI0036651181